MNVNDNYAINNGGQKAVLPDTRVQSEQAAQVQPTGKKVQEPEKAVAQLAETDPKALQDAVEKLSEFVATVSNSSLKISIDEDLSRVVLQVVNNENDETIRQIPAEEVLDLMKRMRDLSEEFFGDTKGLLVENKA